MKNKIKKRTLTRVLKDHYPLYKGVEVQQVVYQEGTLLVAKVLFYGEIFFVEKYILAYNSNRGIVSETIAEAIDLPTIDEIAIDKKTMTTVVVAGKEKEIFVRKGGERFLFSSKKIKK